MRQTFHSAAAKRSLLEQRQFRDAGVWCQGNVYTLNEGVTFGGSYWLSRIDNNKSKPGQGKDWRLIVKKGRDGKDAKPNAED